MPGGAPRRGRRRSCRSQARSCRLQAPYVPLGACWQPCAMSERNGGSQCGDGGTGERVGRLRVLRWRDLSMQRWMPSGLPPLMQSSIEAQTTRKRCSVVTTGVSNGTRCRAPALPPPVAAQRRQRWEMQRGGVGCRWLPANGGHPQMRQEGQSGHGVQQQDGSSSIKSSSIKNRRGGCRA